MGMCLQHERTVLMQKHIMLQQAYAASMAGLFPAACGARKASDFSDGSTAASFVSDSAESTTCSDTASDLSDGEMSPREVKTTVMMRNIPNGYTRDTLVELINKHGFQMAVDLVYLPIDFASQQAFGYAFVNFTSPGQALAFRKHFHGFRTWGVPSQKVCDVLWGSSHQGLQSNIERYRNCPVMHESVPDHFKPALYSNGARVPFPAPTKRLRAPQVTGRRT